MTRRYGNVSGESESTAADWESISGRDDPGQRYAIYNLCDCSDCESRGRLLDCRACDGRGWIPDDGRKSGRRRCRTCTCQTCRGEGKILNLLATAPALADAGVAIGTLGREGAFVDCPLGLLDRSPEPDQPGWIVPPWGRAPTARQASEAGRALGILSGQRRKERGALGV